MAHGLYTAECQGVSQTNSKNSQFDVSKKKIPISSQEEEACTGLMNTELSGITHACDMRFNE